MAYRSQLTSELHKYNKFIPVAFFLVFVLITIPGISWGAPGFWHPDEIVQAADRAMERGKGFDEENFDYPSLPKYVYYGVGQLVYQLGFTKKEFIEAARLVSVILGGLVVALTYQLTRLIGGGITASILAALFVLSSRDMTLNSRFAHNDLFLVFFICLSVLFLIKYRLTNQRVWLYSAFFSVGLAASSKYNGGSMLLAVLVVFLISNRRLITDDILAFLEMLFIGIILSALGYAIGTPRSLTWMAFYFKRATPYILRHAAYNQEPDSLIGLFGQWGVLWSMLGVGVSLLFLGAILWHGRRILILRSKIFQGENRQLELILVFLLCMIVFDLPIAFSYNYQSRFFLAFIPLIAVLIGLFIEAFFAYFDSANYSIFKISSIIVLVIVLTFSFLRVISVSLLFLNDNRIAASEFMTTLRKGKTLEYTLYPPTIPDEYFSEEIKHPLYFKKYPNQPPPERNPSEYNRGEAGIEEREPDYFVVDSFTYDRLDQDGNCSYMKLECEFFQRLFAGKTNYQLLRKFDYSVPPYLPEKSAPFLNPVIQIFQRKGTSPP